MLIGTLTLTACTTDPLQAYPEADSVSDCEVLAKADANQRERSMRAQRGSGNFLIDAVVGGLASGAVEADVNQRLAGCITRVTGAPPAPGQLPAPGQTPTTASAPAASPRMAVRPTTVTPPIPTFGCVPGMGPMQRGTLVCPGF
ncbi:MAG: hypothetical protein AAFM92_11045 [Pseudomonadota bacterium]